MTYTGEIIKQHGGVAGVEITLCNIMPHHLGYRSVFAPSLSILVPHSQAKHFTVGRKVTLTAKLHR